MTEKAHSTKWITPETERRLRRRARQRAGIVRWDIGVAAFRYGAPAIAFVVIMLLFLRIGAGMVVAVSTLSLTVVSLIGRWWGRRACRYFYNEEMIKHPDEWKNYYEIIHISPSAGLEAINTAHQRLSHVYNEVLSDGAKEISGYSLMRDEANEAYQILSNPVSRTAYDRVFWLRSNLQGTQAGKSEKQEIVSSMQSVAEEMQRMEAGKKWISWQIPRWMRLTEQVALPIIVALLPVFLGGTSFAFANPEHLLATPFRGIAVTLAKTSAGAIGLVEDIRGIAATHERSVVTTAFQTMRIDTDSQLIPRVLVSTNDMAAFPSPEYSLYPEYLETRFSQFRYTVDSNGVVRVDVSWATTDAFLGNVKLWLDKAEKDNK